MSHLGLVYHLNNVIKNPGFFFLSAPHLQHIGFFFFFTSWLQDGCCSFTQFHGVQGKKKGTEVTTAMCVPLRMGIESAVSPTKMEKLRGKKRQHSLMPWAKWDVG